MQKIQLDGVYTYLNNVINLKLNDYVKLILNNNNKINPHAIGVYTLDNKKIGYIPYKLNQINLNDKYNICKINLNKNNLQILITNNKNIQNFIYYEPDYIKKIKYNTNFISIKQKINNDYMNYLLQELNKFSNYLKRSNIIFTNLGINYTDNNYINIIIESDNVANLFYTVTKQYYDDNIFKYEEFYEYKLIPLQIFELFKIHRLDIYLQKHYKTIDKKIISKKIRLNILNELDLSITKKIINNTKKIINNNFIDIYKILILKKLESNIINDTIDNYLQENIYLNNLISTLNNDIDIFIKLFNEISEGGLFYDHKIKTYCIIDFYDNNGIIEISDYILYSNQINEEHSITKLDKQLLYLLIKLILSNKDYLYIYNPINHVLTTISLPKESKLKIYKLLI